MRKVLSVLTILMFLGPSFAVPPKVGKIPELKFNPPEPERVVLSNGVIVYLMEDRELPLFSMGITMRISPADVPDKMRGSASLFGTVWRSGGTKNRLPDQLDEELEVLPATVETSAGSEDAAVSLSCLSWDITKGIEIFGDVLLHPRFDKKKLQLARDKALEGLRRKNDNPRNISRRGFRDVLYGPNHEYAFNITEPILKKAKQSDLKKLHEKLIVPDHAIMSVWGDFNKKEVLEKLEEVFAGWKPVKRTVPSYDFGVKNPAQGNLFFVEKGDLTQSRIYMGNLGISRHNADEYALEVADYILGGGGGSRLFAQIRSRLGLAYVVGSFYTKPTGPGLIGVGCSTKAETTLEAVRAIEAELDKFTQTEPIKEELDLAKNAIINSFVFQFESTQNIVNQQVSLEFWGYPKDFLKTYTEKIKAVSAADVLRVAQKYYKKENRKIFVLGAQEKIKGSLKDLGTVTEILLEDID